LKKTESGNLSKGGEKRSKKLRGKKNGRGSGVPTLGKKKQKQKKRRVEKNYSVRNNNRAGIGLNSQVRGVHCARSRGNSTRLHREHEQLHLPGTKKEGKAVGHRGWGELTDKSGFTAQNARSTIAEQPDQTPRPGKKHPERGRNY